MILANSTNLLRPEYEIGHYSKFSAKLLVGASKSKRFNDTVLRRSCFTRLIQPKRIETLALVEVHTLTLCMGKKNPQRGI